MAVPHTPETRERALEALRRSAAEHDGTPRWATVSTETGVTRQTLRRWWQQRGAPPSLHVLRRESAPVTPADNEPDPVDPLAAEPLVYYAHAFARDRRAYQHAVEHGQLSAAARFAERMDGSYERVRAALADAQKRGRGMSREQVEAKLRALAASLAPADAVVLVEGLRARGIA